MRFVTTASPCGGRCHEAHVRDAVRDKGRGQPAGLSRTASVRTHPLDARRSATLRAAAALLDLDGGAGLLELVLELVGLLALDALLDGLGRLVDERLGLLETEAGGRADDLDDLDLL